MVLKQIIKYYKIIWTSFIYSILIFFLPFVISCLDNNKGKQISNSTSDNKKDYKIFPIKRGINISHWLSQNPELDTQILSQIFNKKDVKFLASLGYDHLRIPVDEIHLWDEKGKKQIKIFKLLNEAIGCCIKYNLRVVLDLHEICSHSFNNKKNILWESEKERKYFVQIWLQLSDEFNRYAIDYVAYELLNEAVADNPGDWNDLISITVKAIREKEPNRKIIIGSNRWQSPDTFDQLVVPENDKNIIVSFHFYIPFLLTHYRTPWTEIKDYDGPVQYPGQVINNENLSSYSKGLTEIIKKYNGYYTKDTLLLYIKKPIEFAKKHNLQLYCGEFGCLPTVHRMDRLNWYRDVREIFESNNIAWANWDYKGAFSIYNVQTGNPDEKLISILLGNSIK
jgi:endoglucanase